CLNASPTLPPSTTLFRSDRPVCATRLSRTRLRRQRASVILSRGDGEGSPADGVGYVHRQGIPGFARDDTHVGDRTPFCLAQHREIGREHVCTPVTRSHLI